MNTIRELHAQIDKDFDIGSRALDEEYARRKAELAETRERGHAVLDRHWTNITGEPEPNSSGVSDKAEDSQSFSADDVKSLIESSQPGEHLTVNWFFPRLLREHPMLKERQPKVIRAQISRTLLRFVEEGILEFSRKGKGGQPHIYRRVLTKAVGASAAGQ